VDDASRLSLTVIVITIVTPVPIVCLGPLSLFWKGNGVQLFHSKEEKSVLVLSPNKTLNFHGNPYYYSLSFQSVRHFRTLHTFICFGFFLPLSAR